MALGMGRAWGYIAGGNTSPPLNFWEIWSSVLKGIFPKEYLEKTQTGDDVLNLFNGKRGLMTYTNSSISLGDTPEKCMLSRFTWSHEEPYRMYLQMSILKGLQFRIPEQSNAKNFGEMTAYYEAPDNSSMICQSHLKWTFRVCASCNCTLPSCEHGMIHMGLEHNILKGSSEACLKPGGWFVMFDRAFREYMTHIRAGILAKKLQCCGEFTFKDKSKALNNMNTKLFGTHLGKDPFGTTISTACRTQEYSQYGGDNPFSLALDHNGHAVRDHDGRYARRKVDSLPYFKGLVDEVLPHS